MIPHRRHGGKGSFHNILTLDLNSWIPVLYIASLDAVEGFSLDMALPCPNILYC